MAPSHTESPDDHGALGLRLIAIFKLAKTLTLVACGIVALTLVHRDPTHVAWQWIERLRVDPGNHFVHRALAHVAHFTPGRIELFAAASFAYAALFATEGLGLWLRKRWAEWFTIAITTSFIPLEVWELARHATVVRAGVLAINVVALGYLVARRVHAAQQRRKVYASDQR